MVSNQGGKSRDRERHARAQQSDPAASFVGSKRADGGKAGRTTSWFEEWTDAPYSLDLTVTYDSGSLPDLRPLRPVLHRPRFTVSMLDNGLLMYGFVPDARSSFAWGFAMDGPEGGPFIAEIGEPLTGWTAEQVSAGERFMEEIVDRVAGGAATSAVSLDDAQWSHFYGAAIHRADRLVGTAIDFSRPVLREATRTFRVGYPDALDVDPAGFPYLPQVLEDGAVELWFIGGGRNTFLGTQASSTNFAAVDEPTLHPAQHARFTLADGLTKYHRDRAHDWHAASAWPMVLAYLCEIECLQALAGLPAAWATEVAPPKRWQDPWD